MIQDRDLKSLAFLQVLWKCVKSAVPSVGAEDQLHFQPQEIQWDRGTPWMPWEQSSARAERGSKLSLAWSRTTWTEGVKIPMNIFIYFSFMTMKTTSVSPSAWSQHSTLRVCRNLLIKKHQKNPLHKNEESIYWETDACIFSAVVEMCQKDAVQPNWGQFISNE